jgi:ATP-dependent Clp protease adaptor protein ClpS
MHTTHYITSETVTFEILNAIITTNKKLTLSGEAIQKIENCRSYLDEKIKKVVKQPSRYKVLFLNDSATPMEWVVDLLITIFKHSQQSAEEITMTIHTEGSGVVGIYSYEIAEIRAHEATTLSRNHGFPLQIKIEENEE